MSKQSDAAGGDSSGTGTNSLQQSGQNDPNAARKAIFARHGQLNEAEVQIDRETVPGLSAQPEIEQEPAEAAPEQDLQPAQDVVDSPQPSDPAAQPAPDEMVTLKVFGKEFQKPRSEVDAAGGVDALELKMAADYRRWQADELARKANEAHRDAQDKKRVLEEKVRQVGGVAPNGTPAAQPSQAPAAKTESMTDEQIVQGLYSGEPEAALAAIRELRASKQIGPTTDPAKVAELALAKVEYEFAQREAHQAHQRQITAVNELMASDRFRPIMEDPNVKAMAQREYFAAANDKRNAGRALVEIADEVGGRILGLMGVQPHQAQAAATQPTVQEEVSARTNFKRRIPQPSAASDRAPSAEPTQQYPTKPSEVINMLRAARGQPAQ